MRLTQADIRRPFVIVRHNGRRGSLLAVSTDAEHQTATVIVEGATNVLPASDVICGTCGDTVDACTRSLIHEREHG